MPIKLIIALGNPGKEYENTYHNAGFLFADYLEKNRRVFPPRVDPPRADNFSAKGGQFFRQGRDLAPSGRTIFKSDVYMNESGLFVRKMMKKYGAKPEEILVVHDDSDLMAGEYKFSVGRGAAGHKGAASVIAHLGTKEFSRLRIGIRPKLPPEAERQKAEAFVLKKINKKDMEKIERAIEEAAEELAR
ncbi:MAG TPA: aminoacyl-tRNA hydrolase [Candidatus Paceibacterota bacterium]|nr:aminoacyl-tRNA hydrolase [Candidatus Paceibacterota bacterium]